MAAVEVVSATSAFQPEKVEEPIKTDHENESNTVNETGTAAPAAAEPTPEEPVKETENDVAVPAGKPADAEVEALAAEVEAKVVVDVNQEERVGGDTSKVAPEPEPAAEQTLPRETEPQTKVSTEDAEPAADTKADSEEVKPAAGEVEKEKAGDEAEAAAEKSVE